MLDSRRGMPVDRHGKIGKLVVAAAVLALIALGGVAAWQARSYDLPFGGFYVYRSGAVTSLWRADWAGRRVGLHVRDVVTGVDDRPLAGGGPGMRRELAARRDAGSTTDLALDVRHPDGTTTRVRVPLSRLSTGDMLSTFVLPFSIGLVYLLLGAMIYRYKRTRPAALACALCLLAAAFYLSMF